MECILELGVGIGVESVLELSNPLVEDITLDTVLNKEDIELGDDSETFSTRTMMI